MNDCIETIEVQRAATASDSLVKECYDWFDERCHGEMMDCIHKFAALGWSSERIWRWIRPFMDTKDMMPMSARGHFYLACAFEYAVRQARFIDVK